MISIWGPDINYTPEYWPAWLKIFTVITALVLAAIILHALLRRVMVKKHGSKSEVHKFYLYILPVRLWHWLNALFFITLLVTGLLNHFSIGNTKLMVIWHKYTALAYIALWAVFIIMNIVTGNIRQYAVKWKDFTGRIYKQAKYYLHGILKGAPHPFETTAEDKFNPIQQVSYIGVMFLLVPLIIITGLAALYGHSALMLKFHLALGVAGLIFLMIHLYMCTTGNKPLDLIKAMIDGYHRSN